MKILIQKIWFITLILLSMTIQAEPLDMEKLLELPIEKLLQVKVVSIATGKQQFQSEAPATTTVITAADIEAMGARDLDQVLETVPGLHTIYNNPFQTPAYVIRGLNSIDNSEVLMLINGISIKNLSLGNRGIAWGGMPVNAISRIEVIRGPSSAVYGADAYAGVINIITKHHAEINGTEVGTRLGSYDSQSGWLLHGNDYNGFNVTWMMEYYKTDGFDDNLIYEDAQTINDQRFGSEVSFAPGPLNTQRQSWDMRLDVAKNDWRLRAGYQRRRDLGTGFGGFFALDPLGRFQVDRFNVDLTYYNPKLTKNWEIEAQTYLFDSHEATDPYIYVFPPGVKINDRVKEAGYIADISNQERHAGINIGGFYSGMKNHYWRFGVGYVYADIYQTEYGRNFGLNPYTGQPIAHEVVDMTDTRFELIPEISRQNSFFFVQDEWRLMPDWILTTGLRYDDYSDFGSTWNPRIGLVWQANANLTAKLLYGEAFRVPSVSEMYIQNSQHQLIHFADLKPEKMKNYELGMAYKLKDNFHVSANLFLFNVKDSIFYSPLKSGVYAPSRNVGEREGWGGELEFYWKNSRYFNITGNYAYQHVVNQHDLKLEGAPQHQSYLRTDWQFVPHWYFNTQIHWLSEQGRQAIDSRAPLEGYSDIDMALRRKGWQKHWDFAIGVRNLLDTDRRASSGANVAGQVFLPGDIPLPGRHYFIEARYRF